MATSTLPPYRAQLATLVAAPPEEEGWLHETKYDGYRIGCAVAGGRARLLSRGGKDWTSRLPEVARAAARLPVHAALLDGEVAALRPDGVTDFQALQNAAGGSPALVYFVFDLLHLDGVAVATLPLLERKRRLAALLAGAPAPLRYAPHVEGSGAAVLREACRLGLEGIVSKRADAAYHPGRGAAWTKAKCLARQELVVGGFTEPAGAAREGIGALLVGYREAGARRVAGKVGPGFTRASARSLRARLDPLRRATPPFAPPPRGPLARGARWVEPRLVAEVAFTEWTAGGKLRHPSFLGLREDKAPEDVVRERAAPGIGRSLPSLPPP